MKVTVMSRQDAIKYCDRPHEESTIMISISDPYSMYLDGEPYCGHENRVRAIQPLSFVDAEKPGFDVYRRQVSEADLMTADDAFLVKRLLKRFPDINVIVHCDAGISRSAGIAAAILKFYTGDDSSIMENPRYHPNKRCYQLMLDELMDEEG